MLQTGSHSLLLNGSLSDAKHTRGLLIPHSEAGALDSPPDPSHASYLKSRQSRRSLLPKHTNPADSQLPRIADATMDLAGSRAPAQPVRRSEADEEADTKAVMDNVAAGAYKDWPNDAGVRSTVPSLKYGLA